MQKSLSPVQPPPTIGTETMLPKTEFKLKCPTCGQPILAATKWRGRQIHCPSCETAITIRPPASTLRKGTAATSSKPAARPKAPGRLLRVTLPAKIKRPRKPGRRLKLKVSP